MWKLAEEELADSDKRLAKLIARIGACELKPQKKVEPYDSLIRSIIYQQLHGKAAATILGRLQALFGDRNPTPEEILKTKDAVFRSVGVSGNKTIALKDLAQKTLDGSVPNRKAILKLDDEKIIEQLTSIRGIGQWTVEMFLIFNLGRPDVLPVNDYAIKKAIGQLYRKKEMPTPKEALKLGEKWRPHRTVASWYLWRSLD